MSACISIYNSCLNIREYVLLLSPVSHQYLLQKGGGTQEEKTCTNMQLVLFQRTFRGRFFAAQTDIKSFEINEEEAVKKSFDFS